MFDEIGVVLDPIKKKVGALRIKLPALGIYLRALALAECYNKLIEYTDERTQDHPEVQRVPELRSILLAHLLENAEKHIDPATERIFNPLILGSPKSLREWQEAGFRTKRSASNYRRRLQYWQALYDEAPIIHEVRSRGGEDLFAPRGQIYKRSSRTVEFRQKTLEGKIERREVHYEDVIQARIANYGPSFTLVPWWEMLNYGTVLNGVAGYPNVAGLHFVEDAEKLIPSAMTRYSGAFDDIIADVFDAKEVSNDVMIDVERRARQYIARGTYYIAPDDLARIITFGVPF